MLNYFRKDTHGFFGFPVTESIAPGYFTVVSQPMDLSTMLTKIENNEYATVLEYKVASSSVFNIVCNQI